MKNILFLTAILAGQMALSAIPTKIKSTKNLASTHQNELYQQLAGRQATSAKPSKPSVKVVASAEKALMLARQSRDSKNYILAIKRYNFILKYYAKTTQAKLALIDKSVLYKEMGLPEQAAYNQKKVSKLNTLTTKNSQKTIKR